MTTAQLIGVGLVCFDLALVLVMLLHLLIDGRSRR